ncbi:MAG: hypothetical protein RMI01_07455 [Thermodesulfovibrio sp.]|nr:hypothetical protein [Thermodesulfovibrio sp.]
MPEIVIVDTSVLIALENIDQLHLLCKIYKEIVLPEAVVKEFGNLNLNCLSIKKVESKLLNILLKALNLGRGEAEVIAFSYETGIPALIDDQKARKVAEDLGIKISGTIGLLMKAQKLGILKSAVEKVLELKKKGFLHFR